MNAIKNFVLHRPALAVAVAVALIILSILIPGFAVLPVLAVVGYGARRFATGLGGRAVIALALMVGCAIAAAAIHGSEKAAVESGFPSSGWKDPLASVFLVTAIGCLAYALLLKLQQRAQR